MTIKKLERHDLETVERIFDNYEVWVNQQSWRPSEKVATLTDASMALNKIRALTKQR